MLSCFFCISGGVYIRDSNELTERILESATNEFMEKGFEKASMRVIADHAGVTTGAMYARYSNKDTLFGALVDPVIEKFLCANDKGNEESFDKLNENQETEIWSGAESSSMEIMDLIYENKTAFSLLINCSNGSSYENFIDRIVENEEKEAWEMLNCLKEKGFPCVDVSEEVVHMLISAHCYALFEIVRHDCNREDAQKQVNQINEFFACGWNKIYGL